MVPNANARHFLLKARQRDLIAAAGGIERAAEVCSYGKSTVGRWANADSPELMPLDAIFALEEEAGRFDMSEAICHARGRKLADLDAAQAAANGSVMERHAEAVVQFGELMTAGALAFADMKLTPAEAAGIDRAAARAIDAMAELRKAAAHVRGEGGLSVVAGGAK
ncbi:phage regulatory CII family protein [Mesorhizobium sp. KR9-304]|uniref:phage regulatory CII family protein n=1 Tax=Mesorhizobium sp. KR9-304 TaxID=3156614 RepID=UPI0032B3D2B6